MVLVRVGEHDAEDVASLLDQDSGCPAGSGRCPAGSPRSRTTRRHRPRASAARARAEAVEREIHADLADAAERREHQFSPCGPAIGGSTARALGERRRRPRWPALSPSGSAQHQAAGVVERLEPAGKLASADRTRIGLPSPAARASQSARIGGKARAAVPLREPRRPSRRDSAANRLSGDGATPAAASRSRDSPCRPGWCAQLTPMPIATTAVAALALDQDAGELVAGDQQIVRPFQGEPRRRGPGCAGDRVVHASAATNDSSAQRVRRRRIGQQQARVEIAGLRHPGRGRAGRGPRSASSRRDPQRPALARARHAQRLARWSSRSCRGRSSRTPAALRRWDQARIRTATSPRRRRAVDQRRRIDEEQEIEQAGDAEHDLELAAASARSPAPARRNT